MGRSKLKVALAAEKGTDFKKLKEKKKYKAALKEKAKKAGGRGEEDDEEEDDEEEFDEEEDEEDEERNALIDDEASESDDNEEDEDDEELSADFIAAMDDSDDSDSEVEMEAKIVRPKKADKAEKPAKAEKKAKKGGDDEEEEEEDDELAWSDVDEEERAGLAIRQRQTINNTVALTAALLRIRTFAPTDTSVPFQLHQSITAAVPTTSHPDGTPLDVSDDKVREQALYTQSLTAAVEARRRLRKEGVPFTRPTDYFAEMLKDDGHMAQVKAKLVEAATAQKASAEARKQRDLKKFGKKVQVEKMQERAKEKKDTLEKIKSLKRKRSEFGTTSTHESDAFDVAIDKELSGGAKGGAKGGARGGAGAAGGPNAKRQKKNEKYGFGGKKRHAKSGDAMSSGDLSGFNAKKMKSSGGKPARGRPGQAGTGFRASRGAATRPGKARRKAAAGKR